MLGWLEGLAIKWLTSVLDSVVGWLYKKAATYWKGSEHVKETEKRVENIKDLQAKAKEEIATNGVVSDTTREAIRMAGRELIRGVRN